MMVGGDAVVVRSLLGCLLCVTPPGGAPGTPSDDTRPDQETAVAPEARPSLSVRLRGTLADDEWAKVTRDLWISLSGPRTLLSLRVSRVNAFRDLPPGTYEVSVGSREILATRQVEVSAGRTAILLFDVDRWLTNHRVSEPDHDPRELLRVQRQGCLGPCRTWSLTVLTDGRWQWEMERPVTRRRRGPTTRHRRRAGRLRPAQLSRLQADLAALAEAGPYLEPLIHDLPWVHVRYDVHAEPRRSTYVLRTLRSVSVPPTAVDRLRRRLACAIPIPALRRW